MQIEQRVYIGGQRYAHVMSQRYNRRSYADAIREPAPQLYAQLKSDIMTQLGTPAMRAALKVLQEPPLLSPVTKFNPLVIYAVQNLLQCP